MVGLAEINKSVMDELERLVKKKVIGVVGLTWAKDGWQAEVEVIERRAVPDSQDLIGLFEVKLNKDGKVTSYKRTKLRHRVMSYGTQEIIED